MIGHVILTHLDVGAEPIIQKNTAFNKNFGSTKGTVCEGNDPRLDHSDFYDKTEIDILIQELKRLSAGIKFIIGNEDWTKVNGIFKATITHNLNLNVESFNIAFYQNGESRYFDYKILNNNNFEIYSDEPCVLDIILRQALSCTVAIPTDIREQIENNTLNIENNTLNIDDINKELEIIKNSIGDSSIDLGTLIEEVNSIRNSTDDNTAAIEGILLDLNNKENKGHSHSINDITESKLDILLKDFGNLSNEQTKATVSLAKGSNDEISLYKGPLGELVIDTVNKNIKLQDGETFGGIEIPNLNHKHDYDDLENVPPPQDLSNYYQKNETYSNSEVDSIISGMNIPNLDGIYTKEEVDRFIDDIVFLRGAEGPNESHNGNLMHIVLKHDEDINVLKNDKVFFKNCIEADFTLNQETEFYEINIQHDLGTTNLKVSFNVNGEERFTHYEFIDDNSIKCLSITPINFQVRFERFKEFQDLVPEVPSEGGDTTDVFI